MDGAPASTVYERLVDAAGEAAALKLVAACGGREITLYAKPGGKLARIVGDEAAAALVEAFGAVKITVPMAHLKGGRRRRALVAQKIAEGASVAAAAAAADVHDRTAWRVRRALKDGALPLFDREV